MKKIYSIFIISFLSLCAFAEHSRIDAAGKLYGGMVDEKPLGILAGEMWVEVESVENTTTNTFSISLPMRINAAKYKALINTVLEDAGAYTNQAHNFQEKQEELASVDSIPQGVKLDLKTLHEVLTSWNARHGLESKAWAFPFGQTNLVVVSTNTVWEVVE